MLTIQKCCCCLKLSTGGYIIGVIGAIISVVYIVAIGATLGNYQGAVDKTRINNEDLADFMVNHKELMQAFFWIVLIFAIISLIAYIMLLIGTFKRNSKLMYPVLIIGAVTIVLSFIVALINITHLTCITYFVHAGIDCYFWICNYSLYNALKNNQDAVV